ncbi:MAG: glucose-6-phosphate isomerase, partial [Polaromonas sp.]|nr:glucose-6-phosphate isomerase [Polaromonas sp.]
MKPVRCDRTPAWGELKTCFEAGGRNFDLRGAFARDLHRFEAFSQDAPHVFADLSKNLIDAGSQALLLALARQCGLEQQRDAMFAGQRINRTE